MAMWLNGQQVFGITMTPHQFRQYIRIGIAQLRAIRREVQRDPTDTWMPVLERGQIEYLQRIWGNYRIAQDIESQGTENH